MILRITRNARVEPWDADAASELFLQVDEASRSVLAVVARGTVKGDAPSAEAVADTIELSQREVLGVVREINERTNETAHPAPIVVVTTVEQLPNGRTREQRILTMEAELAELIRDAERAEALAAPHPLLSGRG